MTTLNKALLPSVEFLDSLHYAIATEDGEILMGHLTKREAISLANENTDATGVQFIAIDTRTGEEVK